MFRQHKRVVCRTSILCPVVDCRIYILWKRARRPSKTKMERKKEEGKKQNKREKDGRDIILKLAGACLLSVYINTLVAVVLHQLSVRQEKPQLGAIPGVHARGKRWRVDVDPKRISLSPRAEKLQLQKKAQYKARRACARVRVRRYLRAHICARSYVRAQRTGHSFL